MGVGPKLANETWFWDFEYPVTMAVGENTLFTGNYLLGARDGVKNPETGHKSWLVAWALPRMHLKNICRVSAVCQKRTILKVEQ